MIENNTTEIKREIPCDKIKEEEIDNISTPEVLLNSNNVNNENLVLTPKKGNSVHKTSPRKSSRQSSKKVNVKVSFYQ